MYDRDMDGQLDTDQESPIEESVSEEVIEW
jgi:hypothetical protein